MVGKTLTIFLLVIYFVGDYVGGAELSLETLYDSCPSDKKTKVPSSQITRQLIENNKDAKWVFGNIANVSDEVMAMIAESGIDYTFVEFDYKFCKHRNPVLYQMD